MKRTEKVDKKYFCEVYRYRADDRNRNNDWFEGVTDVEKL